MEFVGRFSGCGEIAGVKCLVLKGGDRGELSQVQLWESIFPP